MGEYSNTYRRIEELEQTKIEDKAMIDLIEATKRLIDVAKERINIRVRTYEEYGEDSSKITSGDVIYYKGDKYETLEDYEKLESILEDEKNMYDEDYYYSDCAIGECNGYLAELRSIDGGY